ncbi:MAG: ectonucleotide pyrophosphatase/phosphodiesterase [Pseudomonadales bacterium]
MRPFARALPLGLLLVLCALGTSGAFAAAAERTVIVLSWDGLRHDYIDRLSLPGLERLARDGVRAGRLITVRPSDTFPSHVSLATGTYPDRHGIVGNLFVDRDLGAYHMSSDTRWLQAEPLWIAAERQGVISATYFWVGSEQDWRGQRSRYRQTPFDSSRPEADKAAQIIAWLRLPAAQRPRLIMSYWRGADSVGHRFGPASKRVDQALAQQDAVLQELLAELDALNRWETLTLILVSDHGMVASGDYLPVREALRDADIEAQVVGQALAHVFLADPEQLPAAQAALEAVDPVLSVITGSAVPAHWRLQHPQRTGDLVLTVPPPYVLTMPTGFAGLVTRTLRWFGWDFGGHGYDPELPAMGAAFLAMGAGVEAGTELAQVRAVDVAATVSQLLDIAPPAHSEGQPLRLQRQP